MIDIAAFTAELFHTRQARARDRIRAGTMSPAQAEAALRPWAAIALRCGADLPEFADEIADMRNPASTFVGRPPDERACRISIADDLCPPTEWRHALSAAHLAAVGKRPADPATHCLTALAIALRAVPLPVPQPERIAA